MAHTRHDRHDLREGEPQQDLVLRLYVGRYLVLSHVFLSFLSFLTFAYLPGACGVGSALSMSTAGSTTAFITSSTTP